mgnify:CR=1 FL=1
MISVDARGHHCPVPSLKLRKSLAGQPAGTRAVLLATDPMARIDIPHLMQALGGQVLTITQDDSVLSITVEIGERRPDSQ